KIAQNCPSEPLPPFPMPPIIASGASTCGDRTPPSTFPFASRAKTTGEMLVTCSRGATGGGVPFVTHWLVQKTAASSTQCAPPVLIGRLQLKMPAGGGVLVGCCIAARLAI